jgi:hypothetical protein
MYVQIQELKAAYRLLALQRIDFVLQFRSFLYVGLSAPEFLAFWLELVLESQSYLEVRVLRLISIPLRPRLQKGGFFRVMRQLTSFRLPTFATILLYQTIQAHCDWQSRHHFLPRQSPRFCMRRTYRKSSLRNSLLRYSARMMYGSPVVVLVLGFQEFTVRRRFRDHPSLPPL